MEVMRKNNRRRKVVYLIVFSRYCIFFDSLSLLPICSFPLLLILHTQIYPCCVTFCHSCHNVCQYNTDNISTSQLSLHSVVCLIIWCETRYRMMLYCVDGHVEISDCTNKQSNLSDDQMSKRQNEDDVERNKTYLKVDYKLMIRYGSFGDFP